jgi:hypothetical protein
MARTSLGLGIGSFVCLGLAIGAVIIALTVFPRELLEQVSTAEEIQELLSNPETIEKLGPAVPISIAAFVLFALSSLAGLLGIITGSLGLSQERRQPTQQGRSFCITSIVLSAPPLLCCVVYCILTAFSVSGIGLP